MTWWRGLAAAAPDVDPGETCLRRAFASTLNCGRRVSAPRLRAMEDRR